jgi:pentose-5-phosphate-3-epimerase
VKEPICINGFLGLVLHVQISSENVAATVDELTVVGVNPGFGTRKGTAHGADLPSRRRVSSMRSGTFRLSKELKDGDVNRREVFKNFHFDWCGRNVACKTLM